jgi:ABC-type protease/lipase transport system fused ATPase/permease subunit
VSIAHRPQTLASADRVLHFAEGAVHATIPLPRQERTSQNEPEAVCARHAVAV